MRLQLIKWRKIMKDNSDIPLPIDQLRCRVLVFAITDQGTQQYQEITKGYVQLSTDEDEKNRTIHYLEVKDQSTNQVLMRSKLTMQKNFGKQKGSIISWTDQQQPQYSELALSFEKDKQCDQFWRTICEKIGKSYLQISGTQKLQIPTSDNLNYLLQKAKNSIDLVDYNIVHSKPIMEGLRQVFYQMKNNNDQMGMGIISRIINAILSPSYSSNAIQTLLTGQNFLMILDMQHFKRNINFREIYDKKVGVFLKNKFNLPRQIFQKIQISHRAVFYRENVLQLSEEGQLESMMFAITKQAVIQIMSYLNRTKFLQKLVASNEYDVNSSKQHLQQQQENHTNTEGDNALQLTQDKIAFIHEALIMYQQITSQQVKSTFKQNMYSGALIQFIKQQIQQNNTKALQILYYIIEMDKVKFFEFLVENFKQNSTDNLLKTLMKKYIHGSQMRRPILSLVESIAFLFNLKRQNLQFFNGTFVFSVFSVSKQPRCILMLANVLLNQLENSSLLFPQFIKLKVFEKLSTQYRHGSGLKTKADELEMVKLLKLIILQQSHKKQMKNTQIEKHIIESGFLDCCMLIYLKHSQRYNIISSSMLQNLRMMERMEYSAFDDYIVREYSQNQLLEKLLAKIKQKHIEFVNKKLEKTQNNQYQEVQRKTHQQIIQKQHQDSYLMNEENQPTLDQNFESQNNSSNNYLNRSKQQKQSQLNNLKRMMREVRDQIDHQQSRQPRKIVNKSHDSQQPSMQISFDLPDLEQFGAQGGT